MSDELAPITDTPIPAPEEPIAPEHARVPGKPGRPKGRENALTRERREFIELVIGAADTKERQEFAASIRRQFMDGTISPAIGTLILQWWLGSPKVTHRLEVDGKIEKVVRTIVDPMAATEQPIDAEVVRG